MPCPVRLLRLQSAVLEEMHAKWAGTCYAVRHEPRRQLYEVTNVVAVLQQVLRVCLSRFVACAAGWLPGFTPETLSRDALEGGRYPPPPLGRPAYAHPLSP